MKLHSLLNLIEPVSGRYGVEIECESDHGPFPSKKKYWFKTHDGSLRKDWNTEYVLKRPMDYKDTVEALEDLQDSFVRKGTVNEPSVRTGVHVHVNCTDFTSTQILNFILVYLSMERALSKYCGPTREGNLFCLRVSDCPGVVRHLKEIFTTGFWSQLGTNDLRYSGLNVSSLVKQGSLEFRSLQTPTNPVDIKEWIDILTAIFEYSKTLEAGVYIPYNISYFSPDLWVRKVLGEELFEAVNYDGLDKDVLKDMRNIQSLYHVKPVDFMGVCPKPEDIEEEDLF